LGPMLMVRGLAVERRGPEEAFVGEDVPIDLAVSCRRGGTRLSVTVRDPHVAPTTVFVPWVRAGETVVARTERRATRRGVTEAGTVQVVSSAPFGVAEARRTVSCPGRTVILPRIVPLRRVPLTAGRDGRVAPLARMGRAEVLRWLAGLKPTGGPPLHAVLEEASASASGPAAYLVVAPTWKPNASAALEQSVRSLGSEGRG